MPRLLVGRGKEPGIHCLCVHIIMANNYLLLPNNNGCDILKVGVLMNDALTHNLQWYLFQSVFISLSAEFNEESAAFFFLEVLDISNTGRI